jgi:PhnB protein
MAITAYLYYEDVDGALKWLSAAFGFKKFGASMSGPDGKLRHAAMKFGDGTIMMGYPGPEYKNPKRLGQATQSLYVDADDVDKHFERAKKSGARILEEPKDTFYGARRYGAADPEGHEWYFAQDIRKERGSARRKTKRA